MSKIVLTLGQIKQLHEFAQEEGQSSYTIEVGTICDGDEIIYGDLKALKNMEFYNWKGRFKK